jgi:hypothetical protein
MTYDEWEKDQFDKNPSATGGLMLGGKGPPPPNVSSMGGILGDFPGTQNLGATVYNSFRRAQDYLSRGMARPTTNPSFSPMGGGRPSFIPPPGERPALQMPGVNSKLQKLLDIRRQLMDLADPQVRYPYSDPNANLALRPKPATPVPPPSIRRDLGQLRDWWNRTGYQEPPNFRAMPKMNNGPEATPYPRPPWLNFRNWMNTGERGPLPLQQYAPGGYPGPANPQMPEVYDTRTAGGALA